MNGAQPRYLDAGFCKRAHLNRFTDFLLQLVPPDARQPELDFIANIGIQRLGPAQKPYGNFSFPRGEELVCRLQ